MSLTAIQDAIETAARDENAVVFYSKHTQMCLTRKPQVDQPTALGQWTMAQAPERIQFHDGVYVARRGRNIGRDGSKWLAPGADQQAERDEVDALKARYDYGKSFHCEGDEPGRALPLERDFHRDVIRALGKLDTAAIESMLEQERSTHKRLDLVLAAEEALKEARSIEADNAAAAAQEPAKP